MTYDNETPGVFFNSMAFWDDSRGIAVGDPIAWAFPKGSGDSLLARADNFLIGADREGYLAQVHDRYYGHTKKFDYVGTRNFIRHYENRLPRYRQMFEEAGAQWGVDWRLLAAIGYQESHWRSGAVSPTGVRGIMMLTEDTAAYLGIDDRVDPKNSIFGGAEYYARQTERVADTVDEPDRTWMALAAYNVGLGHLLDARILTRQQGEWSGYSYEWNQRQDDAFLVDRNGKVRYAYLGALEWDSQENIDVIERVLTQ